MRGYPKDKETRSFAISHEARALLSRETHQKRCMADFNDRRKHVRILGPFDGSRPGLVDMPLQIYDLSAGGCFVNSIHQAPNRGQVFSIQIELPTGEMLVAKGEMAFVRPGFGYGVKFCELNEENRIRLESAIELLTLSGAARQE